MFGRVLKLFSILCLAAVFVPRSPAQSVISARSGLVHFFEGDVYVAGQRLETRMGRFATVPEGAEIRTGQGRAEILLNPGVILRMGENSGARLVDSDIEHTRVEVLQGSAAIDCTQTAPGPALTVLYGQWNVHFLSKGLYRIDSDPPTVRVSTGKAEVASGTQVAVMVEHGMSLPLQKVLVPESSTAPASDALADWSVGRRQSIMADDAISAQIDQDPAVTGDLYAGTLPGVSYFPLLGLSSAALAYGGIYNPYSPYQAGFNSIYLPGYQYRPLLLYLGGGGGYWNSYSGGSATTLFGSTRSVISPAQRMTHLPRPVAPPSRSVGLSHSTFSRPTFSHSMGGHIGGRR